MHAYGGYAETKSMPYYALNNSSNKTSLCKSLPPLPLH
jgi:hypothetical protein